MRSKVIFFYGFPDWNEASMGLKWKNLAATSLITITDSYGSSESLAAKFEK